MRERLELVRSALEEWTERLRGRFAAAGGQPGLPFPPLSLRRLVGPTEKVFFDNPSGDYVWGDLELGPLRPGEAYRRIFDFGCGCGRQARQLLMQEAPPARYVGIDVSARMIRWCRKHLHRPGVEVLFDHHDVRSKTYSPSRTRAWTLPIRHYGTDFTLINAHSVFTHLFERQTEFYLRECCAMLDERGLLRTTWLLLDRGWFPVLAPHQNTVFVNDDDPSQAVYYDWSYLLDLLRRLGLKIVHLNWTRQPGFQTEIYLAAGPGFSDLAPRLEPPGTVAGFGPSRPPPYDGPE